MVILSVYQGVVSFADSRYGTVYSWLYSVDGICFVYGVSTSEVLMIDQEMVNMIVPAVLVFGIIAILFSVLRPFLFKAKKSKFVEIPRDALERVVKNTKKPIKHGLGVKISKKTVYFSGDEIVPGYRLGDIIGGILEPQEYILFIRPRWWMFWKKPLRILVEPELITDFNGDECVIEGKGLYTLDEYHTYVIPCYGIGNLERLDIFRSQNQLSRVLKQHDGDIKSDTDFIPKAALRGQAALAFVELDKVMEMLRMSEEEIRKKFRPEEGGKVESG